MASTRPGLMDDEPDQEALFSLDGPDEDGCVWVCSNAISNPWCQNLGPRDKVSGLAALAKPW